MSNWPACLQGHPDAKTPNIDRLASQGTLFTDAHCQFALCAPSRASLMSGLLPSTLGIETLVPDAETQRRAYQNGTLLLHEYFAENGYKTMAVGKILHQHIPEGSVDMSGGREPFGPTPKPGYKWKSHKTSADWHPWPSSDEKTPDYRAANWTIERLEETHERPFLLMAGFLRPHVPWFVPPKWFDKQASTDSIHLPPYQSDDWNDIPDFAATIAKEPQYPTTQWAIENNEWENIVQAYLACVSFVDRQVGRILDALESSAYADNTYIILWSDHGYHLGEKGLFKKVTLWDRSTRIPLIISGPGSNKGQTVDSVVSLLDIYPTLVELCGLPLNDSNQGQSLVPILENPEIPWEQPAIAKLRGSNYSIVTSQYRYIRYEDGSEELYDRIEDPNEWTNLASRSDLQSVKRQLAAAIPEK